VARGDKSETPAVCRGRDGSGVFTHKDAHAGLDYPVLRDLGRVTTRHDPGASRPADLVNRQFTASRPNQLWVVDFTYVATWAKTVFTAFVTDVFSGNQKKHLRSGAFTGVE
jgi:hypothetical protein